MRRGPLEIRIYLCSPDEAEREMLTCLVLPALQQRASGLGVRVSLIDPESFPPAERGLARRFREIESCLPFFVGIFGESLGDPFGPLPDELRREHAWLAGSAGLSTSEIEVRYVLEEPERARGSFFYFLPAVAARRGPEKGRRRRGEKAAPDATFAPLKERIRASGRPLLEVDLEEGNGRLTKRIVDDLWQAILEEALTARLVSPPLPVAVPQARRAPEPAPVFHDNAQFTVYRPRAVRPLGWYSLLVFAHLGELPTELRGQEPDPVEQVKERAQRTLGGQLQAYAAVTQDSLLGIPHEAEVTLVLGLPGFVVNPPRVTFLWLESVHMEEFRIRAAGELDGQTVRGRLSVFWGNILLAEIPLGLRVDSRSTGVLEMLAAEPLTTSPSRRIFASYSHKDLVIVEQFEILARALGDEYVRDMTHLRAGEVWEEGLRDLIRVANLFQLFWSNNAMRSTFVEKEWRYALSLGRPGFVKPTYWEEPLPEWPEQNLPPQELRALQFQWLGRSVGPRPVLLPAVEAAPAATPTAATPRELGSGPSPILTWGPPTGSGKFRTVGSTRFRNKARLAGSAAMLLLILGTGLAYMQTLSRPYYSPPESSAGVARKQAAGIADGSAAREIRNLEAPPAVLLPKEAPDREGYQVGNARGILSGQDRMEGERRRLERELAVQRVEAERQQRVVQEVQELARLAEVPAPAEPSPAVQPAPASAAPSPTAPHLTDTPAAPAAAVPASSEARARMGDMAADPHVIAPKPLQVPPVSYPEVARRLNLRATVEVLVLVDEDGKVVEVVTVEPSDQYGFAREAIAAARRTVFRPAIKNGTQVKMWTSLTFTFQPGG